MRHELDLWGNAIDSLCEGLRRYRDGREEDPRFYKFAVLHFAHFAELYFKHAVAKEHPLLIWRNPSSKSLEGTRTIGLKEAFAVLSNAGTPLEPDLHRDLEWLRTLRNDIEHYKFTMDIRQVRATLGRVLRATSDFGEGTGLDDLRGLVGYESRDTYDTLLDEYRDRLANAQADAANDSGGLGATVCYSCGESKVAAERAEAVHCHFCDEDEPRHECVICSESFRESEMTPWNEDHPPNVDFVCDSCFDRALGR